MKLKTILFVIESLNCGGAEKSLVTLLNNLNYSNYKIDLILTTKGGDFEKFLPSQVNVIYKNIYSKVNPIELFILRFKYWGLRKLDFKNGYHLSQQFWRVFNKKTENHVVPYDVAIAYGQGLPTYYVDEKVNSKFKYAWLNTDHQKTGYHPLFDYKHYVKFNKIIAVSNESSLSLQKAMISINKQLSIEIIRDISDQNFILKMSGLNEGFYTKKNDSETIILTVCRLEPVKGLNLAIEACEALVKRNIKVKWYVIGEGSERFNLEALIKKKKLEEHFVLLGFNENPYSFMKSCDIYVQSSFFEGLGLTVIEAAILNKPIVTTNFPTASTIINHQETGLICDMKPESIAKAIEKYIDDKNFTSKIIDNLSKQENRDKEKSLNAFNKLIF